LVVKVFHCCVCSEKNVVTLERGKPKRKQKINCWNCGQVYRIKESHAITKIDSSVIMCFYEN